MDRVQVFPGAIPLETDILNTNKNTMIALAKLSAAMLGLNTIANGLACVPTGPASLQVVVNPGEIYSLQNVDNTAYSSLASDTAHQIVKQGILLNAATLNCPAPGTAGQSINYLIQAAYQDLDALPIVLPYYNASNPATAYSGPANSGTTNNTVRQGNCVVAVKAGTAATTGSQTTPAADVGYIGLWVVTVANGQATIVAGNIAAAANQSILPGSLLASLQGNLANYAADTGTANTYVISYSPAVASLKDGMVLWFNAKIANTGASTVAVNGIAAVPLLGAAHSALQGGEIIANGRCMVVYNSTISSFVLIECTGAAVQVASATQPNHAVNQSQVIGVGQTFSNVTGTRALGTTYTNATGKPIVIYVYGVTSAANGYLNIQINTINCVLSQQNFTSSGVGISAVIPAGATYTVTTISTTLSNWYELR
ncbi:phage tail protein [Glaciimonas sp. PCH181]|uniref:phage tail protein n=1 Tax=Glaciimonas sp. PCH181 TaxID=2133943 RepID=UPI000D372592|nr:phage tail protein [Glaciimonas sp. PCH181]PUA19570.1 phage tail protein [Glaciimonas sp. PCH181]